MKKEYLLEYDRLEMNASERDKNYENSSCWLRRRLLERKTKKRRTGDSNAFAVDI